MWFPREIRNALYASGIAPEDVTKLRWEQELHKNPHLTVRLRPDGRVEQTEVSLSMAEHGGLSSPW